MKEYWARLQEALKRDDTKLILRNASNFNNLLEHVMSCTHKVNKAVEFPDRHC